MSAALKAYRSAVARPWMVSRSRWENLAAQCDAAGLADQASDCRSRIGGAAPRGGTRPGAGRPRGDRAPAATGYRPRARDIERARARGLTLAALIDEGLDATAAAEDAAPGVAPLVTIQRALTKT